MGEDGAHRVSVLEHQLLAHPFIKGCRKDDIERLLRRARLVEFAPRDVLFVEGGPADTFYLIRTGVVSLQVQRETGSPRQIQTIHEGTVLGWSWLFEPFVWQFDAVADTPVRAIAIDASELRGEFEEDPGFGYRMVARVAGVMAERLHATRRELHAE